MVEQLSKVTVYNEKYGTRNAGFFKVRKMEMENHECLKGGQPYTKT